MHPIPHPHPVQATAGEVAATVIAQPSAALRECELLNRVGRTLQGISSARAVADAEIRQHALDCAWLMERAMARYQDTQLPADRDEAVLWMHHQQEAMAALSQEWKAAREAQIQHDIATDACYFTARGELDRHALARRVAGA